MQLTGKDGNPVFVNPAQVSLIEQARHPAKTTNGAADRELDDDNVVIYVHGFHTMVRGNAADIAEQLGHA